MKIYFQFDGVHVVSGSLDTSIRVWDVDTGTCKHALMGHQSLTSGEISLEARDYITQHIIAWCLRDGAEGQYSGQRQRRLHSQNLGHPHRTVPSNSLR